MRIHCSDSGLKEAVDYTELKSVVTPPRSTVMRIPDPSPIYLTHPLTTLFPTSASLSAPCPLTASLGSRRGIRHCNRASRRNHSDGRSSASGPASRAWVGIRNGLGARARRWTWSNSR